MKSKLPLENATTANLMVSGNVRGRYQQLLKNAKIKAFDKDIRSEQLLGEASTDNNGFYSIGYSIKNFAATDKNAADVFVRLYNNRNAVLFESGVSYNAAAHLTIDINLSNQPYSGPSEFELVDAAVIPFTGNIPLYSLTENDKVKDISFLTNKTALQQEVIEALAMASRFNARYKIDTAIFYGILRVDNSGGVLTNALSVIEDNSFESKFSYVLDRILSENIDVLMNSIKRAIEANIIPYSFTASLPSTSTSLQEAIQQYAKQNPVSNGSSGLFQKLQIAGLSEKDSGEFIKLFSRNLGSMDAFFNSLETHPVLNKSRNNLKTVFELNSLTGNLPLTAHLVKSKKIKHAVDLEKLAALDHRDWKKIIKEKKIKAPADYANKLEEKFTRKFPTAAFAARMVKDKRTSIPHHAAIGEFLKKHPDFDLLHTRIHHFIRSHPKAFSSKNKSEFSSELKKIQRVFKLAPSYKTANTLIGENIHSAAQVYKIGRDNFIRKYSEKLGKKTAQSVFQKAAQVHAQSVSIAANLKSMSDASLLKVFPDYKTMLSGLTAEVPDLSQLFGNADSCECDECNAVDGAAAYLADILNFLGKRNTNVAGVSVKDLLLVRRPDIGDIDLDCENTNTELPYIDIACELMESYIAAPVIHIAIPALTKGKIDPTTFNKIQAKLVAAGFENVATLFSASATVSDVYTSARYDGTAMVSETHWVIRDALIVLKATRVSAGIDIQLCPQTLLSTDEIAAGPEYLNLPVYQDDPAHSIKGILNNAVRPFSLPFDLFGTEAEQYLSKLGIAKTELIRTFSKEHDTSGPPTTNDLNIAYAYLNIQAKEIELIFQEDLANQVNYWGTIGSGTNAGIDDFESASGLVFTEILTLLQLSFINPSLNITVQNDDLSCDTETKKIINLSPAAFDRIHRFLRLWKKTTLPMDDLDSIIMSPAVGHGKIDALLAVELQHFLELQQAWSLTVSQLLSFYQNIDSERNDNLYNELFQNKKITSPVNPDFAIANTIAGTITITILHKSLISAVVGISLADMELLVAKTNGKLSLENLSFFYRSALLANSLSISIAEEMDIIDVINIDPFADPGSTVLFKNKMSTLNASGLSVEDINYVLRQQDDTANSYVATADEITSALSSLQSGLLQLQGTTIVSPDPQGVLLTKWLSDPLLNWDPSFVKKLLDLLNTPANVNGDVEYSAKITANEKWLGDLWTCFDSPFVAANLGTLPAGLVFPDEFASMISYDPIGHQLKYIGYLSAADQTSLLTLSSDASYQASIKSLFVLSQSTASLPFNVPIGTTSNIAALAAMTSASSTIAERFAFLLNIVAPVYLQIQQQQLVATQITSGFSTDKTIVSQMMKAIPAIFTLFTDPSFTGRQLELASINYPDQFNQYLLLQKICFLVTKLQLSADDVAWQLPHAADINSLDFLTLPLAPVSGPVSSFDQFANLVDVLRMKQFFPIKVLDTSVTPALTISIYDCFMDAINAKPVGNIEADLVTLTGWDPGELKKLVEVPNYLNLQPVTDFKSATILFRLQQCFKVLATLDSGADDAVAWCKNTLNDDDAKNISLKLKSHYTDEEWPGVAQPLQDKLREEKRDALVAYLLANPGSQSWLTDADLYGYFLLDVEMCACQPTSRIVQASNSVQLFVQRCFLGLEQQVKVDTTLDSDWSQWQWMKFFRLWQANYEVFLFPENWIEPELLPVKSSLFSDLENTLSQNEVTDENAQDAFMTYLENLDGIARLEVKGMWYDDPGKALFVVARTYGGDPKLYYQRKLSMVTNTWTPWEKIDLDIKSDHLVPVLYNNRFYLFWALFTEQADTPSDSELTVPMPGQNGLYPPPAKPNKYWQIQMAYSEYRNGKWTPKKVSADDNTGVLPAQINSGNIYYYPEKSAFVFTALDMPQINLAALIEQHDKNNKEVSLAEFLLQSIETSLSQNGDLVIYCYYSEPQSTKTGINNNFVPLGAFDLDPCRGYPVVTPETVLIRPWLFDNSWMLNSLDHENNGHLLSLSGNPVLNDTPSKFNNLVPFQMGFLDRYMAILSALQQSNAQAAKGLVERRTIVTLGTLMSYFFQDAGRTYYVRPELTDNGNFEFLYNDFEELFFAVLEQNTNARDKLLSSVPKNEKLLMMHHYFNFYHPLVCYFMRVLFTKGIDGLMNRDTQLKGDIAYDPDPNKFNFKKVYAPSEIVYDDALNPVTYQNPLTGPVTDSFPGYPKEDVDFDQLSGYSLYNWELFFHAPLMIAERLDQNLQFEDADKWYKYIFNPSDSSAYNSPDKFWITKPFFIDVNEKYTQQKIENILLGVDAGNQGLIKDVTSWRNNPFQPHYIAQYRTVAYQKTTVMKYLDHLIAWGDSLFTQDTMESVNEASQLYLLASQILGPKPQIIPPVYELPVDNFYQLEQKLDALSDALVEIENILPLQTITGYDGTIPQAGMPSLQTLYFCIPSNSKMLAYWDTIADRLFKIRHCLNIDGVFAPLALFAPPIDPGLLVRAEAAGIDLGSILNDLNSPLPNYRFTTMVQKASDLTGEVKSLGASLLAALEKKDAEALAQLRSGQEINVQKSLINVKQQQVKDAQAALDNLNKQKELIAIRQQYYNGLLTNGLSNGELIALALNTASTIVDDAIVAGYILSGVLKLIPDFNVGGAGFGGSPTATAVTGGTSVGNSSEDSAKALAALTTALDKNAALASTVAGYSRRADDWKFQLDMANKELDQVNSQILGAQIRLDISNTDVENQQLLIENAQSSDDFMHTKFTNEDLYSWMISQVSSIYFQGYNLAYATAKKAEQCYRYELGTTLSSFINYGYWNSLKKGLLSGEQLMNDLKKMELSYFDENKREYELTKHISLAQLDPVAFLKLKTSGECWLNIPEELFDMDYPGHYMRRIKSINISIPCIAGPYTTISCTLTLAKNSVRIGAATSGNYPRKTASGINADDARFFDGIGSVQSIATSNGQNDNGLFEMNFRDERYLPFEGCGAISLWRLQLPAVFQQFDYNSVTDVIISLHYTAREGGDELRTMASASVVQAVNTMAVSQADRGLIRMIDVKHEFPTEWYKFLNPPDPAAQQSLSFNITLARFPYFAQHKTIKIVSLELVADSAQILNNVEAVFLTSTYSSVNLLQDSIYGSMMHANINAINKTLPAAGATIEMDYPQTSSLPNTLPLTSDNIKNLFLIMHYQVT